MKEKNSIIYLSIIFRSDYHRTNIIDILYSKQRVNDHTMEMSLIANIYQPQFSF